MQLLLFRTANGPAYVLKSFAKFCQQWGIRRTTGIPHSPTGQAIVEHAHGTLKALLQKQKGGEMSSSAEHIAKVLYVLNYLHLTEGRISPPIIVHQLSPDTNPQQSSPVKVRYRDLIAGEWKGPVEVKLTGRGYVCILAENGPIWVPARWVRPWIEESTQKRGEPTKVQSESPEATPHIVDNAT